MFDKKDRHLKKSWKLILENKMSGEDPCQTGYEMIGTKDKSGREVPNCVPKNESEYHCLDETYLYDENFELTLEGDVDGILVDDDVITEAEYQGRKVKLNKPMRGDVKKFKVYVKDPKTGNVKKVNFGDPNMTIKKSNPARRKSFRARHNCDNPGPKTKARYWSCRKWEESVDYLNEAPDSNVRRAPDGYVEDGYNSTAICSASGIDPSDPKHAKCVGGVRSSYDKSPEDRATSRKKFKSSSLEEDVIPGGKADDKTLKEIAKHHDVPLDDIVDQFSKGIKVEFEHTDCEDKASEIVKDHLMEMPDYYDKLETIEPPKKIDEQEEVDDEEFVIMQAPQDSAEDLIKQYEDDGELSPREIVSELNSDLSELKKAISSYSQKIQRESSNWNVKWQNANRSGKSGNAATSSIGSNNMPLASIDEALQIYVLNDDQKDEKLLDILGFAGNANLINRRQYPKRNVNEAIESGQHNKKGMTLSPFIRDDIIRSSIFGKTEPQAIAKLKEITDKLNAGQQVEWNDFVTVAKNMTGPAGMFLQFLFFDVESNEPLVTQFKEIRDLYKDRESRIRLAKAREIAIDHFDDKISKGSTDQDPLMEGLKRWKKMVQRRFGN